MDKSRCLFPTTNATATNMFQNALTHVLPNAHRAAVEQPQDVLVLRSRDRSLFAGEAAISGHFTLYARGPLYSRKQTLPGDSWMSALCHKRTHTAQQKHERQERLVTQELSRADDMIADGIKAPVAVMAPSHHRNGFQLYAKGFW
jgi:hypothetical protein